MNRAYSWIKVLSTWCVGLLCALAFGQAATASNIAGAIFTTTSDGTKVNGNIYSSKADVYLNGGPQNKNDPGLVPDGEYYFQVTDPSGSVLLSLDNISCRQVTVFNGRIVGHSTVSPATCLHNNGTPDASDGGIPVQLCNPTPALCATDFADTPNPGGEYKVWLTPVGNYPGNNCTTNSRITFGFCDSNSKTDNFKILAGAAHITVCKFNDIDGNGAQDPGEPLIPDWPITVTGVANPPTDTGDDGCVTFGVDDLSATVTVTEGSESGWSPTALIITGPGHINAQTTDDSAVTLSGFKNGDVVEVDFGNHNAQSENTLSASKDAFTTFTVPWHIKKAVDKTSINSANGTETFNYTVTVSHDAATGFAVTGTIKVTSTIDIVDTINVSDAIGATACTITDGSGGVYPPPASGPTLAAGQELDVPYSCAFTSEPSPGTNTATVTVTDSGSNTIASTTATHDFDFANATIVDECVNVTDTNKTKALGQVCYNSDSDTPKDFTYSLDVTADPGKCTTVDNTATFTSTTTSSTTTGTTDNVEVVHCVGADLSVSKTATPSYTRTYNWTITKAVDKTTVEQFGGTATFNYTVVVTETGYTDSDIKVTGSITVSNPNEWESVTLTNVVDKIDNGGTCSITSGNPTATLGKKGSVSPPASTTLGYTCTFTTLPTAKGTNTATASWSSSAASTPDGSKDGTADYTFGAPTKTVNKTVSVTDVFYQDGTTPPGGTALNPATLTANDGPNFTTQKYTYPRTVNVPATNCIKWDNTATVVLDAKPYPTASKQIEVCGPAATGGLTMGFWKNPNGQGIISGQAKTGVCASGTWLRQFAPFQDLSSTATCSQVATYVSNVIGAATCSSGGICSSMLKAQMLATALDVYFSDPALGGDKVAGFNGNNTTKLGSVKVDLTKICPASDGGFSGTSSCEDASSAFGGSPLTVMQMLTYAAGKCINSNPAGSCSNSSGPGTWYGNVKATQVLAKDAFDAINNQRIFSP